MRIHSSLALVAVLTACASANGQTDPTESSTFRSVFSGISDESGNASLTLPSSVGNPSDLPLIAVYVQDGSTWTNVSDGDGTDDGNGSWLIEAPGSGPLVLRMRDLSSRNTTSLLPVSYRVVVIH